MTRLLELVVNLFFLALPIGAFGLLLDEVEPSIIPDRNNTVGDIYFRIFGKIFSEYEEYPFSGNLPIESQYFKKDSSTVFYIHGFIETALQESVEVMVSAYLENKPDMNVILIDWSNMAHGSYFANAAPNTKKVGEAVAEKIKLMLNEGLNLEKIHVIGHSLGAQVSGYIGRTLKKDSILLPRITGLDAAFPAFYPDGVMFNHLDSTDARFVDVIHTDAGGYGAPVKTGTVDFWPNGGKGTQPGCPRLALIPLSDDNLCSHWRSWRFYAESVKTPDAFPATSANSFSEFKSCNNPENEIIYMGIKCSEYDNANGNYYLMTNAVSPFGKGIEGLYYKRRDK